MTATPQPDDITGNGMSQAALYGLLSNIVTLCNNLRTEHTALLADVTAIRTAVTGITAQLDADAGVTDTTYASGNDPAALTTSALTAAALSLSAS